MIHRRTADLICIPNSLRSWKKYMTTNQKSRLVQQDVQDYCVG